MDLYHWIEKHEDKSILDTVIAHLKREYTISEVLAEDLRQDLCLKFLKTTVDTTRDTKQILAFTHKIARGVLAEVFVKQTHPISLCRTRRRKRDSVKGFTGSQLVSGFNFQSADVDALEAIEGRDADDDVLAYEMIDGEIPNLHVSRLPYGELTPANERKLEALLPNLAPTHIEVLMLLMTGENRIGIARHLGRTTRRIEQLMSEIALKAAIKPLDKPTPAESTATVLDLVQRLLHSEPIATCTAEHELVKHAV